MGNKLRFKYGNQIGALRKTLEEKAFLKKEYDEKPFVLPITHIQKVLLIALKYYTHFKDISCEFTRKI